MLSNSLYRYAWRLLLPLIFIAPLLWTAPTTARKNAVRQDTPEQASVPLAYGAAGYRYRVLQGDKVTGL